MECRSVSRVVSKSVSRSVSRVICKSVSRSVSRVVSKSVSRSVSRTESGQIQFGSIFIVLGHTYVYLDVHENLSEVHRSICTFTLLDSTNTFLEVCRNALKQ